MSTQLLESPTTSQMILREDLWWADCSLAAGHEQGGRRPVLILQNNLGNKYSPTVIVAMITAAKKKEMPTHVAIDDPTRFGLERDSKVMLEQIKTMDNWNLMEKIGSLDKSTMWKVDRALQISIGL